MRSLLVAVLTCVITTALYAQSYSGGVPIPGLPKSVGPKPMSGSTSVTIASDQPPIAVTGTFTSTSPDVGLNGMAAPAYSGQVGYVDGDGILRAFPGDANGITVNAIQVTSPWATSRTWLLSDATDSVGVTGTVFSVQSGVLNINNVTGTVSLPTGAATEATLASIGSTITAISGQLPATLGQKTSAESLAVVLASNQGDIAITGTVTASGVVTATPVTATVSTVSRVANSASSQTLLSANADRKQVFLYNDSTTNCYVKFGATASATSFTLKMFFTDTYIMDPPIYTGVIDYICEAADGSMEVNEQ